MRIARDDVPIRYLSIVNLEGGESIVSVPFHELTVDPDLIAGFVTAVIIFAKTPIRTIRKASYDILIEVGESKLVILVLDPVPDEAPYRTKMKQVLEFVESIKLQSNYNYSPKAVLAGLRQVYPPWLQLFVLHCVLSMKGFSWLGLLDVNPIHITRTLLSSTDTQQIDSAFKQHMLPQLCSQIDRGGTTIGLDVQKMTQYGDLAARIDNVLEQRRNEVNDIHLFSDGRSVNLEPLWLTVYGNQVLNALDLGLKCTKDEFANLRSKFRELGFNLRTTQRKTQAIQPAVSEGMKELILGRMNSIRIPNFSPNDKLISSILRAIIAS